MLNMYHIFLPKLRMLSFKRYTSTPIILEAITSTTIAIKNIGMPARTILVSATGVPCAKWAW